MSDVRMSNHESQIIEFLTPFAKDDQRALELLAMSLGRVLNRAAKAGSNWRVLCNDSQAKHIADWLIADVKANAEWLQNTDDLGRAKKLLKFATVEQITKEADKAMLKANQKLGVIKLVDGDEEFFDHLSDGYYLVKLKTPAALDRESAEMQHCVGQGAYDELLENPDYMILSMRDPFGKPHATLEIENETIVQLQGKQNKPPRLDYLKMLVNYFEIEKSGKFYIHLALADNCFVLSSTNEIANMFSLPDGFESKASLTNFGVITNRLPKGLVVNGSLIFPNDSVTVIDDITVKGDAIFQTMRWLKTIGPRIKIGRNLNLGHCPELVNLPDNLKINGHLMLNSCPKLKTLPHGLEVGGILDLSNTAIKAVPEGTKVGEKLIIGGTKINPEALPASLQDDLVIELTSLKTSKKLGNIRRAAKRRQKMEAREAEHSLGMRI